MSAMVKTFRYYYQKKLLSFKVVKMANIDWLIINTLHSEM